MKYTHHSCNGMKGDHKSLSPVSEDRVSAALTVVTSYYTESFEFALVFQQCLDSENGKR